MKPTSLWSLIMTTAMGLLPTTLRTVHCRKGQYYGHKAGDRNMNAIGSHRALRQNDGSAVQIPMMLQRWEAEGNPGGSGRLSAPVYGRKNSQCGSGRGSPMVEPTAVQHDLPIKKMPVRPLSPGMVQPTLVASGKQAVRHAPRVNATQSATHDQMR